VKDKNQQLLLVAQSSNYKSTLWCKKTAPTHSV